MGIEIPGPTEERDGPAIVASSATPDGALAEGRRWLAQVAEYEDDGSDIWKLMAWGKFLVFRLSHMLAMELLAAGPTAQDETPDAATGAIGDRRDGPEPQNRKTP